MDPSLVTMCRQTVTIAPRSSGDGYNQPSYGAAVTYRARVSGERKYVVDDRGEEVLTKFIVYLTTNPAVGARDLLTLSTGDTQSTESGALNPYIIAVERRTDDLGRLSTVLYTG